MADKDKDLIPNAREAKAKPAEGSKGESVNYEQRILVYVDVLGWSDLIAQSVAHPEELKNLNIAQNLLGFLPHSAEKMSEFFADIDQPAPGEVEATHFSDTLVVSCPADTVAASSFLSSIQLTSEMLLCSGHYTRGAIVAGQLYHRGNVVFGPALIMAYKLERDVAKYPRIIVHPDAIPYIDLPVYMKDGSQTRWRNIRTDRDGLQYVDILGFVVGLMNEPRRKRGNEERILEIVREKLNNDAADLGRVAKHAWMLQYLHDILEECEVGTKANQCGPGQ